MFSDHASVTPDSLSLPYQQSHRLGCFRTSLHIWKARELLCLILSLPERRPSALSEDTVLPWETLSPASDLSYSLPLLCVLPEAVLLAHLLIFCLSCNLEHPIPILEIVFPKFGNG